MTDGPRKFDGEDEQTKGLAPENDNSEQDDAAAQANTVADDATARSTDNFGLSDTEKVKGGIEDEDDQQDLVDHMEQMVTSGKIDLSAFRGEPNFDDEEDVLGAAAEEDDPVTAEDQDFDPSEDEEGLPEGDYARSALSLDEVDEDELAEDDEDLDDDDLDDEDDEDEEEK